MSNPLANLTTATKENALTPEERHEFLAEKRVGRLATNRGDGWPHLTPIWYVWEGGIFYLSLGNSRRHLRNIAADPHVTLCVDDDPRISDLSKAPRSVVCYGLAKLLTDEATVLEFTEKLEQRYLGGIPPEFHEALWFEGRTIVEITPQRWLAWDQGKAAGT
jgi:PPOX class probable F420-dependent enzyme